MITTDPHTDRPTGQEQRPNVLLIMTDDQGWDDLGTHGNPWLRTPHLDQLAEDSVQCDNYYVAAVCSASRASLLTGRHFLRTGVAHVHGGKDFIHPDEVLLPELFQQAGYATGMWGKWHSGKSSGYFPWERGFDDAYMARLYKHHDSVGHRNGVYEEHNGWAVDTLTDMCLEFIDKSTQEKKPFFAYLPHMTVHGPLQAPDDMVKYFTDQGLSHGLAQIYAMVEQLDTSIGNLLQGLEDLGVADNTIVLFMSDNGPAVSDNILTDEDRRLRYVNGYKGHKGNMWENGIKSPLFVRWPRHYTPHHVQRVVDICDILPTLCSCCDIPIADDHPALDGRDVHSYFSDDEHSLPSKHSFLAVNPGWPPDPINRPYTVDGYFDEYRPITIQEKSQQNFNEQLIGLRTDQWKLMRNPGTVPGSPDLHNDAVLINMSTDPKEDHNCAADEQQQIEEMTSLVREWFQGICDDPHSFHTPRFAIGDKQSNFIAAYAPERVRGNIINGGISCNGWTSVGDGADYKVAVQTAGRYRIGLEAQIPDNTALDVRIRFADNESHIRIDSSRASLGTFTLPQGDCTLSIDLLGLPQQATERSYLNMFHCEQVVE